jgi:hypothetical protein
VGSTHRATCICGYETVVTVGGGRATFREVSYFPHYCRDCGLVEANIADASGPVATCPKCKRRDASAYGSTEVSMPTTNAQVAFTWGDYQVMERGNLCPECWCMTLIFHRPSEMLFD